MRKSEIEPARYPLATSSVGGNCSQYGEMLCTWARDYGISGTGIDLSQLFTEQAELRADQLGVADRVEFIHGDAAGYVAEEKVGVAACLGATWIGGGVVGRELLASFGELDYDVVEMVLADRDSWDRYEAAKRLTMRRRLAR